MKPMISAALLAAMTAMPSHAEQIAITIDDLPYVMQSRTNPDQGLANVEAVNQALEEHGITATGFVIGGAINDDTRPALRAFAEAGHTIGNHSWSHPDYSTLSLEEFREETQRTDEVITEWLSENRFYRFPYLREGETAQTKEAATRVLDELGYQNAPVTIDNDEWRFNADYMDALEAGDDAAAEQIAADYLEHMKERTRHFQVLGQEAVGRDVAHVLLIHMNQLNADHLGELLAWYETEGWEFVTLKTALTDPLYSAPDIYEGSRGLSQIERVMGEASE